MAKHNEVTAGAPEVTGAGIHEVDRFGREELSELMRHADAPCVSIYMQTHRAGNETQQDPIRLKNLLKQAHEKLVEQGMKPTKAESILRPGRELHEDEGFWPHQADGLAVLIAGGFFRRYRLPLAFEELCVVADGFHVKPLLPLLTTDGAFYILALGENKVRVLKGTRDTVTELNVSGVPESKADALKHDDPQRQLQWHSSAGASPGGPGRSAMFHGHGAGADDEKTDLLRYFQMIDRGLHSVLAEETTPLVLAGVDYYFAIYRQANTYAHLLPEGVVGNTDVLRNEEIHARAWKVVEPYFKAGQEAAREQYMTFKSNGRASDSLEDVLHAAAEGRVATLFVALGERIWGRPNGDSFDIREVQEPGDKDLLNEAALTTIMNGGRVFALKREEVPGQVPIAAVFRY